MTGAVTLPIVALGAGAVKAAMDFETSFSGVAKTVDGVANKSGKLTKFGEELQQQFRDMAKRLPISVNEINKIGEAAGALGIPGAKIAQFTEVMAKLGATTNLTSDEAATAIAQIQNVYRSAGVDTDRFASALVALGNAGASTEKQIVEFAARMGGAAVQANISQAEVLGWANAMASVGLNAELGSTAWNKAVSQIGVAVDLGNAKMKGFAEVAGMSADGFKALFKSDASEAVNRVVEGFGRIKESGGNLTQVMNELGMKNSGMQMTFKNLAGAGDMVRQSLNLGKQAWQDNTAMEEEFGKKAATTASQLQILWNRVMDVAITFGMALIPNMLKLMPVAEAVLGAISRMVTWFANLPSGVQATIIGIAGFAAALGPVLYLIGNIVSAGGALVGVFKLIGGASVLAPLAPTFNGAALAVSGLASAFMSIPYVAIAASFGLIAAAIAGIAYALPKATDAVEGLYGAWQKGGWRAVLGEMGRNVKNDDLSFFKGYRLDQQGKGKSPAEAPVDEAQQMANSIMKQQTLMKEVAKRFPDVAKIMGLGGADKKSAAASNKAAKEAERAAEAWQKFNDQISGKAALDAANDWLKHLSDVGGITQLTDKAQKDLNNSLGDALEYYARIGQTAPKAMTDVYLATLQFKAPLVSFNEMTNGGRNLLPGAERVQPFNPLSPTLRDIFVPQVPGGISSGLTFPVGQTINPLANAPHISKLNEIFGDARQVGSDIGHAFVAAAQNAQSWGSFFRGLLSNVGSLIGGRLGDWAGGLASGIGGMLGGALGAILPGIGQMLGPLLGKLGGGIAKLFGRGDDGDKQRDAFLKQMGGFDALAKKLHELGAEGDALFKNLIGAKSGKAAEDAINGVTAALDKYEDKLKQIEEGTKTFTAGAVTRVKAFFDEFLKDDKLDALTGANRLGGDQGSRQGQFDQMALYAGTAFAQTLTQSGAQEALTALGPTFDQLIKLQQELGFTLSGATAQFVSFYQTAQANADVVAALDGLNQMIRGAGDALFMNQELFSTFSADVVTQFNTLSERGVGIGQIFALMQPTLQSLWEAQQKFHFETDASTQALIDQAVQQGIVGENMKSVNQQILDVLVAIGDALGAKIPNALRGLPTVAAQAAAGMNDAFSHVRMPDLPPGVDWEQAVSDRPKADLGALEVPEMAAGGIVRKPTLAMIGEAGPEAVVPLGSGGGGGGGMLQPIMLQIDGETVAEVIVPIIPRVVKRYGL